MLEFSSIIDPERSPDSFLAIWCPGASRNIDLCVADFEFELEFGSNVVKIETLSS